MVATARRAALVLTLAVIAPADAHAATVRAGANAWCATTRQGARDDVWAHREQRSRPGSPARSARVSDFDLGQVAVLVDAGDLALPRNPLDLQGTALRFTPSADGYAVSRLALPLETAAGSRLSLADDDSEKVSLGFSFSFFGRSYSEVFVNSDGNVSFGEKDDASTERNVGRLVTGPPRAAPLLADLDPSARGAVSVLAQHDHVTVTWEAVAQYGHIDANTFQVSLWADGRVDFVYGQALSASIDQGVVGLGPGAAQGGLTAVDFSAAVQVSGPGTLAESFRAQGNIDTVAVGQRFYASHPDDYQQLVVYTSQTLVPSNVVAYSRPVRNTDRGIGEDVYDLSRDFGSAGRLESFIMMDAITKYPDDLSQRFVGEDSALSVLAHEVGHRWLAKARFRDGNVDSTELLGRDQVHWSFFLDSDGSFDEGNDIQPQSDGTFKTVGASLRYSDLDQYLMGLRDASEVQPFFFVRNPRGAGADPGRKPQSGVVFNGTRKDVTIADVTAALGTRNPPGNPWTRPLRQAFVYVALGSPDAAALEKLERIRASWPAFFFQGADQRGSVDPTLH